MTELMRDFYHVEKRIAWESMDIPEPDRSKSPRLSALYTKLDKLAMILSKI